MLSVEVDMGQEISLTQCNSCGKTVSIMSEKKLMNEQVQELQNRMLCSECLKKQLKAKDG